MSKHTELPWKIDGEADVVSADGNWIARCGLSHFIPEAEQVANAHLITAAPDLLEACKEFVRKVDAGEARSVRSYAQMKAAIAKAEGRS